MPESSETQQPSTDREGGRGAVASQVSREIVQLHARLYGRGPTKAKTYVHDDYILCLLEDVFTPAERTLVKAGNTAQVEASRRAFQEAVRDEFVSVVEAAAGRKVRALISQINYEPELSTELFLMEARFPTRAVTPPNQRTR